ncbi:hypothetical protein JCM10212_007074 [Sporobolomyces blumeae]
MPTANSGTHSTLVFPSAVDSLQADRGVIRGQLRDTYNRLHSIAADAEFIEDEVARAFPDFPLIANQRAGAWYVKPSVNHAHAYFKSTDGHANEHNFNLRRANLSLLPLIKERKGIVLVDSTRRGKRFPDALSKTVPLWCATLNAARMKLLAPAPSNSSVSPQDWEEQSRLFTAPQAVGPSEHAQIAAKIHRWADELVTSSYNFESLKTLDRPLRPFFVSPSSTLSLNSASAFPTCFPIVCASASKLAEEADGMERARGFTYVQGSGDDHEAWSKGLTPKTFWEHSDEILSASREDVDSVIARIVEDAALASTMASTSLASAPRDTSIRVRSTRIRLGFACEPSPVEASDRQIVVGTAKDASSPSVETHDPSNLSVKPRKAGYPAFFGRLDSTLAFAAKTLRGQEGDVVISVRLSEAQSEANDLGVALALILLVRFYDDAGALLDAPPATVSKDLIRSRLQWILEAFPTINPSRAVLNRVNEYMMRARR